MENTLEVDKCVFCGNNRETVWHIASQCMPLFKKEYEKSQQYIARTFHWTLFNMYRLERAKTYYENKSQGFIENDNAKIL